jgi:hypothetical protein
MCPGPHVSRREILQVGTAAALGLSLPQLLRANGGRSKAHADHCILVFLNGGPSHLDMWDPKPHAPMEIRGEFKTIPTTVPGVQFGEHLPRTARLMHHCALIRSAHHSVNNAHAAGVYTALTGHDRGDATTAIGAGPDDHPAVGSVVGMLRPPGRTVLPYVALPFITKEGAGGPPQPGFFGGWLGRPRDPFWVLNDPNVANFGLPELSLAPDIDPDRFDARKQLITKLRVSSTAVDRTLADMDAFQTKAFDLLTAPETRNALQIDRESPKTRDAYGRNIYGQSVLLARRLIEAGTRVVCISWAPDANATWDTHGQNFQKLKNELLPQYDMAVSSLLTDLIERGLFERTLVVVMGEFGRTPKINASAGRDHWNFCYSLMLAGGGIVGGAVYGASDRIGAKPSRNPVTPADVIATVYECLGLSPETEIVDRLGRPFALVPWGRPIAELIG